MVDSTYMPKVFKTDGGDAMKVASGGHIDIETGGELRIGGTAITATAAEINAAAGTGVSSTELDLLDGALVDTVVTSKAAVYSTAGGLKRSSATVTALSSDQAGAAALTAEFNAATAANGTKGVKLPTAAADKVVDIVNTSASAVLKVYPATGGQINELGANAAFSIGPGRTAKFIGRSTTLWYTADSEAELATVAEVNLVNTAVVGSVVNSKAAIYSSVGGLARSSASVTALSSDQAGAAAMTAEINSVTAANDTKAVKLPTAAANLVIDVINTVRTASLNVYPATGGQINALGANAVYVLKPGQRATFIGKSATLWHTGVNPLGEATSDKVGFYGTTPVVQPASASQAAFTAQTYTAVGTTTFSQAGTGAYAGVWGFASSTVALTLRTELNKVITDMALQNTLLLQLRAELVELGAIKGAA